MEDGIQRKIVWFQKRLSEQEQLIESLEQNRQFDRSGSAQKNIREAKKEKLRLKDNIEWLKKLESQLRKN